MIDNYRALNGTLSNGGTYAPHQYFPPRLVYPHNFLQSNPRVQFCRGQGPHQGYLGPPQYRHPPPVQMPIQSRDMEVISVISVPGEHEIFWPQSGGLCLLSCNSLTLYLSSNNSLLLGRECKRDGAVCSQPEREPDASLLHPL